jgi:S1-C subfamily serine protease
MFEFLAAKGQLAPWYRAYVEPFSEDETGRAAFEAVFGRPLNEIERDWRLWLMSQPELDTDIDESEASIGIVSSDHGANDGVRIERIIPGSSAAGSMLRVGDIIVGAGGRPTRSMSELRRVVAAGRIGDSLDLRVRRGEEYFRLSLTLRRLPAG